VFASSGCGSCHTLDGASASGQIGPNLDQIKPTYATVLRQVAGGGNGMPSFRRKLSGDAMRAVARFVSTSAARSPAPPRFRPDRRTPADCAVDFACLKQAYGNIAFYQGPETALERLDRAQRASQAIAGFCHQITHEIGHAALARYDGDSAKALGHGTMTCWSGYYHGVVERAFVLPPASRIGPISAEERNAVMDRSPVKGVYDKTIDRESAYEKLANRAAVSAGGVAPAPPGNGSNAGGGILDSLKGSLGGLMTGSGRKDSLVEAMAKSAVRTMGSTVGREIVRGVLGSLLGGRRR